MKTENLKRRIRNEEVQVFETRYEEVENWLGNIESPKTRSEYTKHLIRYCESTELNPTQLIELKQKGDKAHKAEKLLNKFVRESQKSKYPNSMLCSTVIAVKSFYKWNLEELESACGKVTRIKLKPYRTPDRDNIKAFLEGSHLRDNALITLIASTGISKGSIPDLKWSHVWEDLIKNPKEIPHIGLGSTEIKGKGRGSYANIEQHTFLTPYACDVLLKYKHWRERKEKRKMTPEDYMFVTLDKPYKQLELITITAIFLRRSEETGIEFSCHDFRRFVQTQLETARLQPNWIKKILRHKVKGEENPYSRPKIEELRTAYRTAIPYLDLSEKQTTKSETAIILGQIEHLLRRLPQSEREQAFESVLNRLPEHEKINIQKMAKADPIIEELLRQQEETQEDCQQIINESELEQWLAKGYRFIAKLNNNKVIVEKNNH